MTHSDADFHSDHCAPTLVTGLGDVPREMTDLDDGRTMAWQQTGQGRDLLAIHGTLVTLEDMMLGPMPALSRHFRVTAVDRPGHGYSTRHRLIDASPWRQAEIIHDFAKRIGLERPIILGHSYGGAVALAYASLYPSEVAGVVALAPICLPELRLEMMIFGPRAAPLTGQALAHALSATSDRALLPLLWRAMYLPQPMPQEVASNFPFSLARQPDRMVVEGEDALRLLPGLARLAAAYPSCQVPIRFLAGTADAVVNNALQGRIAASLLKNATFKWLAGMGHMLHHFRPDEVTAAALDL